MIVKCLSMLLHLARLFPTSRFAEIVGTWKGTAFRGSGEVGGGGGGGILYF